MSHMVATTKAQTTTPQPLSSRSGFCFRNSNGLKCPAAESWPFLNHEFDWWAPTAAECDAFRILCVFVSMANDDKSHSQTTNTKSIQNSLPILAMTGPITGQSSHQSCWHRVDSKPIIADTVWTKEPVRLGIVGWPEGGCLGAYCGQAFQSSGGAR